MQVRQIAISAVLIVMVCTAGVALAQGGSGHMQFHPKPQRGSTMQMHGMMQQMSGMMEHMAARIQAGPLAPEQAKEMSEAMVHMSDMMNHLVWMISGGTAGSSGPGGAVSSADMPQQMTTMLERMTEIHKRMMTIMAAPKQDKK